MDFFLDTTACDLEEGAATGPLLWEWYAYDLKHSLSQDTRGKNSH